MTSTTTNNSETTGTNMNYGVGAKPEAPRRSLCVTHCTEDRIVMKRVKTGDIKIYDWANNARKEKDFTTVSMAVYNPIALNIMFSRAVVCVIPLEEKFRKLLTCIEKGARIEIEEERVYARVTAAEMREWCQGAIEMIGNTDACAPLAALRAHMNSDSPSEDSNMVAVTCW